MHRCVNPKCKWHGELTPERTGLDQMNRPVCGMCRTMAAKVQHAATPVAGSSEPPPGYARRTAEGEIDPSSIEVVDAADIGGVINDDDDNEDDAPDLDPLIY